MSKPVTWKAALGFVDNEEPKWIITDGKWGSPKLATCIDEDTARLMAAAPELLTALIETRSWMEDCLFDKQAIGLPSREAYEVVRAAIAKAKG